MNMHKDNILGQMNKQFTEKNLLNVIRTKKIRHIFNTISNYEILKAIFANMEMFYVRETVIEY